MTIEIKKSIKPINYNQAISLLEKRVENIYNNRASELIWVLEHTHIYTAGTSHKEHEILDKSIKVIKTNRGGKITYHGPGQLIFYFVINLNKRKKDIRKFIKLIEKTIINTLNEYKIKTFSDRKNIGIWFKDKKEIKKVGAIGIKVKKWIAFHGFSININNDLKKYKSIIPCGIKDRGIISLEKIKKQNYKKLNNDLIKNFIKYLND
jgi:lipoyl(octanoyl) transferase